MIDLIQYLLDLGVTFYLYDWKVTGIHLNYDNHLELHLARENELVSLTLVRTLPLWMVTCNRNGETKTRIVKVDGLAKTLEEILK